MLLLLLDFAPTANRTYRLLDFPQRLQGQLQMMDRCKALEVTETEIYELKLALEEQLRIMQNRQL